jgi:hypothetical protein
VQHPEDSHLYTRRRENTQAHENFLLIRPVAYRTNSNIGPWSSSGYARPDSSFLWTDLHWCKTDVWKGIGKRWETSKYLASR